MIWNQILNTQELLTLISFQPLPIQSSPLFIVNCRAAEGQSFTHGGGVWRGEGGEEDCTTGQPEIWNFSIYPMDI